MAFLEHKLRSRCKTANLEPPCRQTWDSSSASSSFTSADPKRPNTHTHTHTHTHTPAPDPKGGGEGRRGEPPSPGDPQRTKGGGGGPARPERAGRRGKVRTTNRESGQVRHRSPRQQQRQQYSCTPPQPIGCRRMPRCSNCTAPGLAAFNRKVGQN